MQQLGHLLTSLVQRRYRPSYETLSMCHQPVSERLDQLDGRFGLSLDASLDICNILNLRLQPLTSNISRCIWCSHSDIGMHLSRSTFWVKFHLKFIAINYLRHVDNGVRHCVNKKFRAFLSWFIIFSCSKISAMSGSSPSQFLCHSSRYMCIYYSPVSRVDVPKLRGITSVK